MKPIVNKMTRRQALSGLVALSMLSMSAVLPVHAQSDYPTRNIRLIVPYAPGGATDVIGRVLGKELGDALGQTFVVENRAGAGGSLGAGQVAKAAADGYTLLMGAFTSHTINAALTPEIVPFSIDKSFDYVSVVGTVPLVFAVNKQVPAQTVLELAELSKKQPGAISFASAGTGSPQHLAIEMFKQQTGADVIHVPYRGSGPALADLMGGQVNVMIDTVPAALGMLKSGDLRALATTTQERVPSLPDVPTVVEAGMPDMQISSMFAIAAPAGTPTEVIEKLNSTLKTVLSNPAVQESMLAQGTLATYATPEESTRMITSEFEKWQKLIKENDIKVE